MNKPKRVLHTLEATEFYLLALSSDLKKALVMHPETYELEITETNQLMVGWSSSSNFLDNVDFHAELWDQFIEDWSE